MAELTVPHSLDYVLDEPRISLLDKQSGRLYYSGYTIEALAAQASY